MSVRPERANRFGDWATPDFEMLIIKNGREKLKPLRRFFDPLGVIFPDTVGWG